MQKSLYTLAALNGIASACFDHEVATPPRIRGRQVAEITDPGRQAKDWTYLLPEAWGFVNPDYAVCFNGTQQGPIGLSTSAGSSLVHIPSFNYSATTGDFYNWGYGPGYAVDHPKGDFTGLPSFTFDNETVYLDSWHTHTPAEHPVDGKRSRAELHLVHKTANGDYRAVLAIRIDVGPTQSPFFASLPTYIGFNDTSVMHNVKLDNTLALKEVDRFSKFWTYSGSLTVPPCSEGLRFFIAQDVLSVSSEQMQALLGVSVYSTRDEQALWDQGVNV